MERTITVRGIGRAEARPDLTVITLSVEGMNRDYEMAMTLGADKVRRLQSSLLRAGMDPKELKTVNFTVDTRSHSEKNRYGNYESVFDGYAAVYRLRLSFDFDSDRLSAVIAALSHANASPEMSIRFTVKDAEAVADAVLADAAKNARRQAAVLAEAAGGKLGELLSISYNWEELDVYSSTNMGELRCMEASPIGAAPMEIEPEDINASESAVFVWALEA